MKVELIAHTPNADEIVAKAAKLCYSKVGVEEIGQKLTPEKIQKFVKMLADMGHGSPIEHVSFTFAIEGISRTTSHQLVRHRIASYSQQSQRYVDLDKTFGYITPPQISGNRQAQQIYENTVDVIHSAYNHIADLLHRQLIEKGVEPKAARKIAIEDARYILPNACETKMVVTMNARTLLHFFHHRCCNRAQWEIRNLADEMLELVKGVASAIFSNCGAPCENGKCTEGPMTCGEPRRRD